MHRYAALALTLALTACSAHDQPSAPPARTDPSPASPAPAPLALVYRGPAGCDGCSEAVAQLLRGSKLHFDVTFVGPSEVEPTVTQALLAKAALYAQPGGDGTVEQAWEYVKSFAPLIPEFVRAGGRYIGFCMGGFFAGTSPGYGLLPGDSDEFITSPGASVTDDANTTVDVVWRGAPRTIFFQDGPYFIVDPSAQGVTVLATYASNHEIAALVAPYGKGKVGVTGPHPEATQDWFDAAMIAKPTFAFDLGEDLVETLMKVD